MQAASRFLFLSMAILVIEQDIKNVQQGAFKIKEPYMEILESMINEASKEKRHLRKTMRDKKIKIATLQQNKSFSSFLFQCAGKEEQRNYFNPIIRKKVEAIIRELMLKAISPDYANISADV